MTTTMADRRARGRRGRGEGGVGWGCGGGGGGAAAAAADDDDSAVVTVLFSFNLPSLAAPSGLRTKPLGSGGLGARPKTM